MRFQILRIKVGCFLLGVVGPIVMLYLFWFLANYDPQWTWEQTAIGIPLFGGLALCSPFGARYIYRDQMDRIRLNQRLARLTAR